MNERLTIPKKIKVGFQNRQSTYSGLLAYITYFDNKGKLRKEKSWNDWRNKNIGPKEFNNIPTSGFVLNKKAGGYASGWNHRNTYCRVWDPRGFEFEITVENLLFILEECTSTKGKGLEGEFVYAWDRKDLVLLPVSSEDYKASVMLENKKEKITSKNIIVGGSYKSKLSDELIFLGKENYYYFQRNNNNNNNTGPIFTFELKSCKMFIFYDRIKKQLRYCRDTKHIDFLIDDKTMMPFEVSEYLEKYYDTFEGGADKISHAVIDTSEEKVNPFVNRFIDNLYLEREDMIYHLYMPDNSIYYLTKSIKNWYELTKKEQKEIFLDFAKNHDFSTLRVYKVMKYDFKNKHFEIQTPKYDSNTIFLSKDEQNFIRQNILSNFKVVGVREDGTKLKSFRNVLCHNTTFKDYHNL